MHTHAKLNALIKKKKCFFGYRENSASLHKCRKPNRSKLTVTGHRTPKKRAKSDYSKIERDNIHEGDRQT